LYAGLFGLLGAAFVGNVIYPSPPTAMLRVAVVGWVASVVGLSLVTWIQATEAGISFGQLLDTSLGRAAILRLAPLLVAGVALTSQVVGRSISVRALGTAGIGAAGALLADALASHAAAGTHANGHAPHLDVIIQWAHLAGAGVWLGGLVALLTSLRGQDREATARAARRFATSALLGIILVAATGVLRAWSEIGGPGNLLSTDFGRLLIAKSTLVLVLGGLGAVNHFRNVPAVTRSTRPLRRIGVLELAVGSTVLLLSASLVNLSPPARNPAATTNPANIAATTSER
jgi:copper transport protein